MNNIDINFRNSKFYIVIVRIDNYNEGEHSFYTSEFLFISKREAEKIKNELFAHEVDNYFTEREIVLPDDLSDYESYNINMDYVNDSAFREDISWIDSDNLYISATIKELILDTKL